MSSIANVSDPSAIEFLQSRIDYERSLSMPYGQRDFRLERMRELAARLGNPQDGLSIVHVAGTKGKGSTSAMVAAMLTAAGVKTGLYSSPHLERLEERLAIDGAACPPNILARLVDELRPLVAELDEAAAAQTPPTHGPTYFELLTALAFNHFAHSRCRAAVLEVGLGGRLDSTNVCRPLLTIITSISFDHTRQLGNTLAAIAGEKAGIIKAGVPVLSGAVAPEARQAIAAVARRLGAPLVELGREIHVDYRPPCHLEERPATGSVDIACTAPGLEFHYRDLPLGLLGSHQAANAALAVTAIAALRRHGIAVEEAAVRQGLAGVRWPARIEVLGRRPTVILDAAHNGASVDALLRVLDESFASGRRLLVFATTRDKDVAEMLRLALPKFDHAIFTRYVENPRGVPPEQLAAQAAAQGSSSWTVCPDPTAAWEEVRRRATPETLVCITGSFFTAAEMGAQVRQRPLWGQA